MICALLIFQTPELPAPLAQLSPWLDHLIVPREEAYARLAAQDHRRFIKTHTPLDGIPLHPRATYIVTARHPLDMAVTEYRASLDAAISFSNGGDLTVHGFRIDLPSPDAGEAEMAALFIASLGLLMTDSVELSNVHVFAEPHKGTRGGPSDHRLGPTTTTGRLVELSHIIRAGMSTYPGLPAPAIARGPPAARSGSATRQRPARGAAERAPRPVIGQRDEHQSRHRLHRRRR
jgi:hypothetical protein